MGLNKPKRAWMSLEISSNEPKWAQILLKFLLVMHINVRDDTCYDFSSDITNVKNKERIVSVVHFHKAFRLRSLTLFDLRPVFCNKWNTSWRYNSVKFLEDSNFGSHGRFFMEYSPKYDPIFTKALPVLQCKVMHDICECF